MDIAPWIKKFNDERFNENRYHLIKIVEKDLKLIAWICWGLGLLFKELTYQEMFEYIGSATEADLSEYIKVANPPIKTRWKESFISANLFELYEDGKIIGYLNIQNQLTIYPLEKFVTGDYEYLNSHYILQSIISLVTNLYRNIAPVTEIWIFPKCPESSKNTVELQPVKRFLQTLNFNYNKDDSDVPESTGGTELELRVYEYHLGNPLEVKKDIMENNNVAGKLSTLLQLLDILFIFNLSKETRLELAHKRFNLTGEHVELEALYMAELERIFNSLIEK